MIRYINTRYNTILYGTVQYGTVQYDILRYGTLQYDTIRYDTIRYKLSSILLFIDCVAHLCADKGRYNEMYPLTIYILVTPPWYLVVCKRIILKWKGVFVACFCLCEICVCRVTACISRLHARVRMYERERMSERLRWKGKGWGRDRFCYKNLIRRNDF